MHEHHDVDTRRRASALHLYIRALDEGDADALSVVLRQAQHDAVLEQLLMTLQDVYLDAEEITVHSDEVTQARELIRAQALDDGNGRYQTGDAEAEMVILPRRQEQTRGKGRQEMQMGDTPEAPIADGQDSQGVSHEVESQVRPLATIEAQTGNVSAATRRSRTVVFIQAIAAVLVVVVMIGSFYTLFSTHLAQRGKNTRGNVHGTVSLTGATLASGEDVVLVGSRDGDVLALRAHDGTLMWRYATGTTYPITALAALDGVVYSNTEQGDLAAVRIADGKLLWQRSFNQFEGFPVSLKVMSGVVLAPLGDGVTVLRASDGALLWRNASDRVLGAGDGIIYTGHSEMATPASITTGPVQMQSVKALRASDGMLLWNHPLHRRAEEAYAVFTSADVAYLSTSFSTGDASYIALSALHTVDGTTIWTHEKSNLAPSFSPPFYVTGPLFFAHVDQRICAYRADTGADQWCTPTPGLDRAVAADDNSVYLCRYESNASAMLLAVGALRGDDGTQRWYWRSEPQRSQTGNNRYGISTGGVGPSVAALDGVAYAGATQGVYAIGGSDGHQLWHTLDSETVMSLIAAKAA